MLTVLGWVVNGSLNGSNGAPEEELLSAMVNRISLYKLEKMLTNQYNQEFNERKQEKREMSREDLKFQETMRHSAMLQDGKYLNCP